MAKLKLTNAIAEDLKTAASDSFIDSLKMIEIEDIQPNEDNFYEMSEIEELAEDIERQGLMSVLIVETAENGKYRLISGHRRLTAIKRLVDEGRYKSTTVPCYVKSAKSHEETQLDLIMMNATQRKYPRYIAVLFQIQQICGGYALALIGVFSEILGCELHLGGEIGEKNSEQAEVTEIKPLIGDNLRESNIVGKPVNNRLCVALVRCSAKLSVIHSVSPHQRWCVFFGVGATHSKPILAKFSFHLP